MNAKDKAALDELVETMKTTMEDSITAALQPLVDEMIALTQRSSNFAAGVNAKFAALRAENAALREKLASLETA